MTETIDVEQAIETIEEGTHAEKVETLGELSNYSHEQPDVFIPHLDNICAFADNEDSDIQSFVAAIISSVSRYDSNVVLPYADVVCSLLSNDDPHVVSFAATAAVEIASVSPETLMSETDRLFELLPYENTQASRAARSIRMRAVLTLTHLVDADPSLAVRFDAPLAERLEDTEPEVRAVSVMALAGFGVNQPETVPTALAHLPARLEDPDPETRRHAIGAYVNFRHKQPDAIVDPETVAPAFKEAADSVDLDDDETKKVSETHQYIASLAAA